MGAQWPQRSGHLRSVELMTTNPGWVGLLYLWPGGGFKDFCMFTSTWGHDPI